MAVGKPGRGSDQFALRLPDGMRDRIKAAADKSGRSMNAEMVARLEASFAARPDKETTELNAMKAIIEVLRRSGALDLERLSEIQTELRETKD